MQRGLLVSFSKLQIFRSPARGLTEIHNKKGHVAYIVLANVPALFTIEACGIFIVNQATNPLSCAAPFRKVTTERHPFVLDVFFRYLLLSFLFKNSSLIYLHPFSWSAVPLTLSLLFNLSHSSQACCPFLIQF